MTTFFEDKTRVVIAGSAAQECIQRVLHTMAYYDHPISYVLQTPFRGEQEHFNDSEFGLIEGTEGDALLSYAPQVVLLTDVNPLQETLYESFIDSISKGGILIYNEEDSVLKALATASKNEIRRLEYSTPAYTESDGECYLMTPEGELPLGVMKAEDIRNIEGAKWVCQNLGIDEADFYEAMASFKY